MSNIEIILIVCFLIAFGVFVYVMFSSSITLTPYKPKNPEKDWKIRATHDTASWAERNNFDFLGFYTIHYGTMRNFMTAWKSREKSKYLCQYIIRNGGLTVIVRDIITIFENEIELTTSNTKDSNLLPKPLGEYSQSFSKCSFDELYRNHREAEEFLIARGGAKEDKSEIDFEEHFIGSLKKENRYHWKHCT